MSGEKSNNLEHLRGSLLLRADVHGQVRDIDLVTIANGAGVKYDSVADLRRQLIGARLIVDMAAAGLSRVVRS